MVERTAIEFGRNMRVHYNDTPIGRKHGKCVLLPSDTVFMSTSVVNDDGQTDAGFVARKALPALSELYLDVLGLFRSILSTPDWSPLSGNDTPTCHVLLRGKVRRPDGLTLRVSYQPEDDGNQYNAYVRDGNRLLASFPLTSHDLHAAQDEAVRLCRPWLRKLMDEIPQAETACLHIAYPKEGED